MCVKPCIIFIYCHFISNTPCFLEAWRWFQIRNHYWSIPFKQPTYMWERVCRFDLMSSCRPIWNGNFNPSRQRIILSNDFKWIQISVKLSNLVISIVATMGDVFIVASNVIWLTTAPMTLMKRAAVSIVLKCKFIMYKELALVMRKCMPFFIIQMLILPLTASSTKNVLDTRSANPIRILKCT